MRARLWAGDPAPLLAAAEPDTLDGGRREILLTGSGLQPGIEPGLIRPGSPAIAPVELEWIDYDRVRVVFDGADIRAGWFDLLVANPDGQTFVREDAVLRAGEVVSSPPDRLPSHAALDQNFPNPFNPATTLRYELPRDASIELAVFDLRGRRVTTLHRGPQTAGYHDARWDGRDDQGRAVASGLYFARLAGPGFTEARKMMLAR